MQCLPIFFSAMRLLLSLLSHCLPQALYPCTSNTHTGTPPLEAITTPSSQYFHSSCATQVHSSNLRLGGTETLCHSARTHTEPPQCQMLMHLLIWSSKLKLPYFFSGFRFQHLHSKLPLARSWFCLLYNAGLQQSMFCPQIMIQPAADMNAVPTSVILTVRSKMAVKAPGINQIDFYIILCKAKKKKKP